MTAQLDLLAGLPVPPAETAAQAIARARAFVDGVKARRVCVDCCGDDRLLFVHRARQPRSIEVSDLVLLGASTVRIREELARCEVVCRRCLLGRWTPQRLRSGRRRLGRNSGERSQTGIRAA